MHNEIGVQSSICLYQFGSPFTSNELSRVVSKLLLSSAINNFFLKFLLINIFSSYFSNRLQRQERTLQKLGEKR